jgi:hypothetical protein
MTDQWFHSYGNALWELDDSGLMRRRQASIAEAERCYFGVQPDHERGPEHHIPMQ